VTYHLPKGRFGVCIEHDDADTGRDIGSRIHTSRVTWQAVQAWFHFAVMRIVSAQGSEGLERCGKDCEFISRQGETIGNDWLTNYPKAKVNTKQFGSVERQTTETQSSVKTETDTANERPVHVGTSALRATPFFPPSSYLHRGMRLHAKLTNRAYDLA
jgi:hypothetical protein